MQRKLVSMAQEQICFPFDFMDMIFSCENVWLRFQQMLCQTKTTTKWACSSPPPSEPSPWWLQCTASTTSSTPSSSTCTRSLTMTQVSQLIHHSCLGTSHCLQGLTEGRDWACQNTHVLLFGTTKWHHNKKPVNCGEKKTDKHKKWQNEAKD